MNRKEAKRLERRIRMDAPSLRVNVIQIGNGEWVCVLNGGDIWIWDKQDWEKNKNSPMVLAKLMIA
jgi:hypothetical protein